jgi:hypothetical protein
VVVAPEAAEALAVAAGDDVLALPL